MAKRAPKRKKVGLEHPTCNCIMLCDDVLMSAGKGKHTLQGVINAIFVDQMPYVLGGHVAYLRLSNVYGTQKVTVALEDPAGEAIFAFEAKLGSPAGPLQVHTLVVPILPFRVDERGRYTFVAKAADGTILAMTPIVFDALGTGSSE